MQGELRTTERWIKPLQESERLKQLRPRNGIGISL
uniref:Uncharacterized protein n=2 Tax=Leersia perrieri TaxID=77586 RepID=A0A0D9VYW9_9ORYZ